MSASSRSRYARLLGLGEVKFETGGGDGEDAKLSYVSLSEAERLRETIKARKAGQAATTGETAAVEEESGATVFAMDTGRLLTLGLYSFSLVIFAVLGGVAQQFDFLLSLRYMGHRARGSAWPKTMASPSRR
jgi:putative membrane protein